MNAQREGHPPAAQVLPTLSLMDASGKVIPPGHALYSLSEERYEELCEESTEYGPFAEIRYHITLDLDAGVISFLSDYDEPGCLQMVDGYEAVIPIHGEPGTVCHDSLKEQAASVWPDLSTPEARQGVEKLYKETIVRHFAEKMKYKDTFDDRVVELLGDMRKAITFKPDPERDIVLFLRQYRTATEGQRKNILYCVSACVKGERYPDPQAGRYPYTEAEVQKCRAVFDEYFLKGLPGAEGDPEGIQQEMELTRKQLEALNSRCGEQLITESGREELYAILRDAAELAGIGPRLDITDGPRM